MRIRVFRILVWLVAALTVSAEQIRVAVLDFSVPAAESNRWSWAEGGVADQLQIELQQQGLLLLDRDGIQAVLAEQRLATSGRTAENSLAVAKLLNAQFLIDGKVIPLAGERFRIEARVFSVETVETAASAVGEGNFPKDLSLMVQQVADQIAKKLPARTGFANETRPAIRAPKPESLIMFYRGLNACAVGRPEWGAGYFINAASLDPDFTVPLLWEIKAYEMAGLPQIAALRREELALLSGTNASATPASHTTGQMSLPVLALLNPVISVPAGTLNAAELADSVRQALLADHRVRVFAYEGIGAAVAEQDLRLSSFFISQNAPRYGRWLTTDAVVFCQVKPDVVGKLEIKLSLINPLNASVLASVQGVQSNTALSGNIQNLTRELLALWLKQPKVATTLTTLAASNLTSGDLGSDLRPIYRALANALVMAQREPEKGDSHRSLANAFGAAGRTRLAAYEIEECLRRLDIHAPHADTTYVGTHRWLFWEPSPASGAVGLVNQQLIDHMIEQLLTNYPHTLAAGCMHYNLAVTAWRGNNWRETIAQAQPARQILRSLVAGYDLKTPTGANRGDAEFEMIAASYFLEGSSLVKLDRPDAAKVIFHQGLEFMQTYKVRDFCLPLGPYIGDFFGPERVYGFGGDPPGIKTRLEAELTKLGETIVRPPRPEPPPTAVTKEPGADSIQRGQLEFQKGNYQPALECYQKAVAAGASVTACPGLAFALLEVALDNKPDHPADEIEKLRLELGLPPIQASWVEWFGTGRKYQTARQYDLEKAVACYRGAMDFLEHPEQRGVYRLEKEPCCNRTNLLWGKSIGEIELRWTIKYDERWYSAAFYLAHCLIKLDRKEEAAPWLRQIAIKVGGDSSLPLLERDTWNSSGWSSDNLGVRSAELLQDLHMVKKRGAIGLMDGPYQLPPRIAKAKPLPVPPLPSVDVTLLQPLTNALMEAGKTRIPRERKERLQPVIAKYGHQLVPVALSFLYQEPCAWDKNLLVLLLEQTADTNDAPWVVNAATREYGLIKLAQRLDPKTTASVLAEEWQRQEANNLVSPGLIQEIIKGRVRPLFPLVLDQIAEVKANHWNDVVLLDGILASEQSRELAAAFCEALAQCLKQKLAVENHYQIGLIAHIALKHGIPEGIDGVRVAEESLPAQLRASLKSYLDLPPDDAGLVPFLRRNHGLWKWNPDTKKFGLPKAEG
jgi:tetratricopeptide (TPR) repeat protein